jgi:NedA-like, galactose-binding domain
MKLSNPTLKSAYAPSILILLVPFLMLYWMLPFISDWTLGNDYPCYSIQEQMELMFSLKTGAFPLYAPGYIGGQSASALTLGQIFHPISHLTALLPGYWNGKALELNTLFRLITLGAAHLSLFAFLRRLSFSGLLAFILSFITVYNLRMLDLFRYGASLESWTGHIFLCSAMGCYYLKPTKWRGPLLIIGATYWLVCSGHPQMMYYGLLGAGLFAIVLPYFIAIVLPDSHVDMQKVKPFWLRAGFFCGMGILLSSAYILPFYFDFITANTERVHQGYIWASKDIDSFIGTLNNFFQPLLSDVSGVFGGSSLFLAAALVPALKFFKIKIPGVIWAIWVLALLVFLHMQGPRTLIHYIAWKYLPFGSSFRIPGRISLIIPILLMLLLAWITQSQAVHLKFFRTRHLTSPATIIALVSIFLYGVYALILFLITSNSTSSCAAAIRQIPPWVISAIPVLGILSLAALAAHGISRMKFSVELLLCITICLQIMFTLKYGTWIEHKKDTPNFAQMLAQKQAKLDYRPLPGIGMSSSVVIRHVKQSPLEPFLGKVYRKYRIAQSNDSAYSLMKKNHMPDRLIVEGYIPGPTPPRKKKANENTTDRVKLAFSSFNRLVFDVWASDSGFFSMAYPYSGHWEALVCGKQTRVYRANGATHAVRIPAGHSIVEFRYWSQSTFLAMIISYATLTLIGLFFCFYTLNKPVNILAFVAVIALGTGFFTIWHQSIFNGKNLGTVYSWTSNPPASLINLAYGKRTHMKSIVHHISSGILYSTDYNNRRNSGRLVDGDRSPGSGFITNLQLNPWWIVDLHQTELIGSILVYPGVPGSKRNTRPVAVMISNDGKIWQNLGNINLAQLKPPVRVKIKKPVQSRYVLLKAIGSCRLAIDEVEIYPPVNNNIP